METGLIIVATRSMMMTIVLIASVPYWPIRSPSIVHGAMIPVGGVVAAYGGFKMGRAIRAKFKLDQAKA